METDQCSQHDVDVTSVPLAAAVTGVGATPLGMFGDGRSVPAFGGGRWDVLTAHGDSGRPLLFTGCMRSKVRCPVIHKEEQFVS